MPAAESPRACVITRASWSPASGDPRFSRTTPDALLARFQARCTLPPGNYPEQLAHGFADYLRKHPKNSPSRKRKKERFALFALPKKKEKTSDAMIFTGSPALSLPAPVARQETAEVKSRVKSARDGA